MKKRLKIKRLPRCYLRNTCQDTTLQNIILSFKLLKGPYVTYDLAGQECVEQGPIFEIQFQIGGASEHF